MKKQNLLINMSVARQWDSDPISILKAIKLWPVDRNAALSKLKSGKVNDSETQNLYDTWANKMSDFWEIVFYMSSSKANFATFKSDLKWQAENERNSLNKSLKAWNASPRQNIRAYYNLLWGQRYNPEALRNYRACWKKDKERVMKWLQDSQW